MCLFVFSRRKNGFYPECMSTVYTRYKRPGDFDVLSSTVRDLKMVQQETRKLDGQCMDFCDVLKGRCFLFLFFHRQTVCQKLQCSEELQKDSN